MMRVVMLPGSISRLAGGLFTSVRRLSQSINDDLSVDCEVRAIGLADNFTGLDRAKWSVPVDIVNARGVFRAGLSASDLLIENAPSLVHGHFLWSYGSLASLRWHRKTRKPYVISPRGMLDPWALRNSAWKKRLAMFAYERSHLKKAFCFHALCDSEAHAIRALGLKQPIIVIPNGIDLPDAQQLSVVTKPWNTVQSRDKTLLFMSRLHPKKNLEGLLQGWSLAKNAMTNWKLIIAGWGEDSYVNHLHKLCSILEISGDVEFLGPIADGEKNSALHLSTAFILPSFSEGLPIAVLEAWAYRKPVLITKECNLEIGFSKKAAIEINQEPENICHSLKQLASADMSELDRMGENGCRLVREYFQWSAIAETMCKTYSWMLGESCDSLPFYAN